MPFLAKIAYLGGKPKYSYRWTIPIVFRPKVWPKPEYFRYRSLTSLWAGYQRWNILVILSVPIISLFNILFCIVHGIARSLDQTDPFLVLLSTGARVYNMTIGDGHLPPAPGAWLPQGVESINWYQIGNYDHITYKIFWQCIMWLFSQSAIPYWKTLDYLYLSCLWWKPICYVVEFVKWYFVNLWHTVIPCQHHHCCLCLLYYPTKW